MMMEVRRLSLQLVWLVSLVSLLPASVSEPSITTTSFTRGPGDSGSSATPGIFSLPLTEGLEHSLYNSSKGVNITIPANYSRHSLPSGVLTRVNIGGLLLTY